MVRKPIGMSQVGGTRILCQPMAVFLFGVVGGLGLDNYQGWIPFFDGLSHWQWYALLLVPPIVIIVIHYRLRPSMGVWGLFALTSAAFWAGLTLGIEMDDFGPRGHFMQFGFAGWLINFTFGTFFICGKPPHHEPRRGPYCPQCGYCVVGLSENRCPECGRPFTAAELGVSEDELRAEPSANTDEREP